jgi:hypothetical protein
VSYRRRPDGFDGPKSLVSISALLGIALALPSLAPCQADYDRPRSIASVIAEQRDLVLQAVTAYPERSFALGGISFPSLSSIQYMDSARAISPERRDLIRRWLISYEVGLENLESYQRELLFREDSLLVWMPVQSALVADFERMGRRESVTLFLVWVGARGRPENLDWLFIVYGFRSR